MRFLSPTLLTLLVAQAWAADMAPRPVAPMLAATTGAIGNSLVRTFDPDDMYGMRNMAYVQNYTGSIAVSEDGKVYSNTPWKEGHRPAGVYQDGDCLIEQPDFGNGSGNLVALSPSWVAFGHWSTIVLCERKPGQAFDGNGGKARREFKITTMEKPPQVSGLAIDEAHNRIWVATEDGQVRCFTLTGEATAIPAIILTGAGALTLDHLGNLWALQTIKAADEAPVTGTVISSPAAKDHGPEQAAGIKDTEWFESAGADGFCGLVLAAPTTQAGFRFTGAEGAVLVGGAVEVSEHGAEGPWTTVMDIHQEPSGWPDTYVTLPTAKPLIAVRVRGPHVSLRKLTVFAAIPRRTARIVCFSPEGKPLPQAIADLPDVASIQADPLRKRLLVCTSKSSNQVLAYTGLDGKPALDPTFGSKGAFGVKGGVYTGSGPQVGSIGDQRFDALRGAGADAAGNLYVAMVGNQGLPQTRYESYDPTGALRWRISGLSFIDGADMDPLDETSVWGAANRFRID